MKQRGHALNKNKKLKQNKLYLDLPIAPLLYAVNQSANTSDIFDSLAHKKSTSLVPTAAMPRERERESKHPQEKTQNINAANPNSWT